MDAGGQRFDTQEHRSFQEQCNPIDISLEVYDEFLAKADHILDLGRFAKRIIIDATGFYVTPLGFKAKMGATTIVIAALWPLFGIWVLCRIVLKMAERRHMLCRCSFQLDPCIRAAMALIMFICGSVSWGCFPPKAQVWTFRYEFDTAAGELSTLEVLQPSLVLLWCVVALVHELALLRLEQSAATQLSNELHEYDVWLANSISDIPGGFEDLHKTLDLLGSIFSSTCEGSQVPIHKLSGSDLYTRLFHNRQDSEISTWTLDSVDSSYTLQVKIHGKQLSSQFRVALERQHSRMKVLVWILVALLQASIPSLTRVFLQRSPPYISTYTFSFAGPYYQLVFMLFIPINFIATMAFLSYWDDAIKRLNRLTRLIALILYLFGTNSSRTAIAGQFTKHLSHISVNRAERRGERREYDFFGELSKLDAYDHKQFFEYVDQRLWKGGDKVNYQTVQAFLSIRKYMNIVVATERVRVQQVFMASFYMVLLCIGVVAGELLLNHGKVVSASTVYCVATLILLMIFLITVLSTAVVVNEGLADATTFLLESWRENIHMQRFVLLQQPLPIGSSAITALDQARGSAVETADRALEFLVRFVEKRQVYIGFCSIPITRKFLQSVFWTISTSVVFIVVLFVVKYVSVIQMPTRG